MAFTEIERKFLVAGEYKAESFDATRITQGYISTTPGRTVRVRVRGEKGYLTIKGPVTGLTRFEWEKEIPADEAGMLMGLCSQVIDKTRYLVKASDGHVWEVDEFYGDNEGLTVAEVELGSEDEAFVKPGWLGDEVTGDRRYYNSSLTINPYKNWK